MLAASLNEEDVDLVDARAEGLRRDERSEALDTSSSSQNQVVSPRTRPLTAIASSTPSSRRPATTWHEMRAGRKPDARRTSAALSSSSTSTATVVERSVTPLTSRPRSALFVPIRKSESWPSPNSLGLVPKRLVAVADHLGERRVHAPSPCAAARAPTMLALAGIRAPRSDSRPPATEAESRGRRRSSEGCRRCARAASRPRVRIWFGYFTNNGMFVMSARLFARHGSAAVARTEAHTVVGDDDDQWIGRRDPLGRACATPARSAPSTYPTWSRYR